MRSAVSGAAGEGTAVSVIAFCVGIVGAPAFFIAATVAVITWLRRFDVQVPEPCGLRPFHLQNGKHLIHRCVSQSPTALT